MGTELRRDLARGREALCRWWELRGTHGQLGAAPGKAERPRRTVDTG